MGVTHPGVFGLIVLLLVGLDTTHAAVLVQILLRVVMEMTALKWAATSKQQNATVGRNAFLRS